MNPFPELGILHVSLSSPWCQILLVSGLFASSDTRAFSFPRGDMGVDVEGEICGYLNTLLLTETTFLCLSFLLSSLTDKLDLSASSSAFGVCFIYMAFPMDNHLLISFKDRLGGHTQHLYLHFDNGKGSPINLS